MSLIHICSKLDEGFQGLFTSKKPILRMRTIYTLSTYITKYVPILSLFWVSLVCMRFNAIIAHRTCFCLLAARFKLLFPCIINKWNRKGILEAHALQLILHVRYVVVVVVNKYSSFR